MDRNQETGEGNVAAIGKGVFDYADYIFSDDPGITVEDRIHNFLLCIQPVYYPILALVAVPVNVMTIVVLSRGKCGLSKGVTIYLLAMATADLLVVVLDLILRQIPMIYSEAFRFLRYIPVCNIHAVLLYAATDCSVWFTVAFTFDRFVAICCQTLKAKYCTERTVAVVLGTVTVLSCLKNTFWYFMLSGEYLFIILPWFCWGRDGVMHSVDWTAVEFLHYTLTPVLPFVLIILLNALTIRFVLLASRGRSRLRGSSSGERPRDPEMESRKKSLILLLVVSGNFILLWTLFTVHSVWRRLYDIDEAVVPSLITRELGYMLQLLSCCTNTALYAMTQTKFREQLKDVVKSPLTLSVRCAQRGEELRNPRRSPAGTNDVSPTPNTPEGGFYTGKNIVSTL